MAINIKTIEELLAYLRTEIKTIEKSRVTIERIFDKEDLDFVDATKHRMQIAVEIVINIAEHLVAGLNLGQPESAKALFPLLVKERIINKDLSDNLVEAVGLRNILVHQYRDVDLNILTNAATTDLDDLREFAKSINEFLEKQPN